MPIPEIDMEERRNKKVGEGGAFVPSRGNIPSYIFSKFDYRQ